MPLKTEGVRLLVQDVLQTLPQPYGEDVIEDVFCEIEKTPQWRKRYNELVEELTLLVVNSAIGRHTKALIGFDTLREVDVRRTRLSKNYSKLIPA